MLYDIVSGRWDPELLELFAVPERALPRVLASAGILGETRPRRARTATPSPSPASRAISRRPCSARRASSPGMGKNTYGTGSFVLLNAGSTAPPPEPGLLATVAWGIGGSTPEAPFRAASRTGAATAYALEASIFVTGAAVQWLRDGLGIIERADQTEALAASLQSNDGVYFVPALTGLGSPHWDPYARGTIVGLTRGAGRAHLARATLEAIAYQTLDAVRAMEAASGEPLSELRADGGASANAWLMQFQADVLGVPVVLPEITETTALGAAYLAGVGVGHVDTRTTCARPGASARAMSRAWARTSATAC